MKRLPQLFAAAFMAAASFLAAAQTTTVNLAPFTPEKCAAAKALLGDTTLNCSDKFTAAPLPVTVTLSNLPDGITTATTASIIATATPAGSTLWCRRDIYNPGPCPNPFVLGASTPLAAGVHRVDYYVVVGGVAPDASKPAKSYSWVISATTPPPPPPPASSPPPPPTGTALASLPYPVPANVDPQPSVSYAQAGTITGNDGVVRMQRVADPGGSGQQVYLHRIVRSDGSVSGTAMGRSVRSEKVWIDTTAGRMKPGNDYWLAFAFRPKSGEWPAQKAGLSDDGFLVFQTHSESNGDTYPPITLNLDTGTGRMRWLTSYGTATQATSPSGTAEPNVQPLPPVDVWRKYVVHMRPGWTASQNPITEVWESVGSGPFVKLFSSTAPNDYNWSSGSYARIGIYKWGGTNWQSGVPTIACYLSTLFMETGANKYDAAVAAVAAFK